MLNGTLNAACHCRFPWIPNGFFWCPAVACFLVIQRLFLVPGRACFLGDPTSFSGAPPCVRDGFFTVVVYQLSGIFFFVVADILHGCADRGCCMVRLHRGDLGVRDQQFWPQRQGAKKVRRFSFRLLRVLFPAKNGIIHPSAFFIRSFFTHEKRNDYIYRQTPT